MTRTRKALAVVGIAAALLVPGVARVGAGQAHPVPLRLVHVVRAGETLWGIARSVAPSTDTGATVARLMRTNHLRTPTLHPGQPLFLPAH